MTGIQNNVFNTQLLGVIPQTPNVHGKDFHHGVSEAGIDALSALESEEDIIGTSLRSTELERGIKEAQDTL